MSGFYSVHSTSWSIFEDLKIWMQPPRKSKAKSWARFSPTSYPFEVKKAYVESPVEIGSVYPESSRIPEQWPLAPPSPCSSPLSRHQEQDIGALVWCQYPGCSLWLALHCPLGGAGCTALRHRRNCSEPPPDIVRIKWSPGPSWRTVLLSKQTF